MTRFKTALFSFLCGIAFLLTTPLTVFAGSDVTPPTINAAVNNGTLTVEAVDESGIEIIYVNGYEFYNPKDGKLSIKLEKFEAGVKEFTIAAADRAGNRTQDYVIPNPYWSDPSVANDNSNQDDPSESLPVSASPTDPSSATGEVTEHDFYYLAENPGYSREFYTIETESGKVFYLIIINEDDNRTVHFLTDINENDLLNTTENNSETLPKNSIGADYSYMTVGLPEVDSTATESKPDTTKPTSTISTETKPAQQTTVGTQTQPITQQTQSQQTAEPDSTDEVAEDTAPKKSNPLLLYGGGGLLLFGILYYTKIGKKKKNGGNEEFIEDEDEADIEDDLRAEEESAEAEDGEEEDKSEYGIYGRDQSDEDFFNSLDDEDEEGN